VLSVSAGISKGETVALMSAKGELVAIGNAVLSTDEMTSLKKGLTCSTERVIMKQGTYPKMWKGHAKVKAA
jgi:H/ACA ribonucleoprotein complex subunit 4